MVNGHIVLFLGSWLLQRSGLAKKHLNPTIASSPMSIGALPLASNKFVFLPTKP